MAADPRSRNSRHLATAQEPRPLEFAGPKLEAAFNYGPAPLCLSGGFNSGKTITMCLKMLTIADIYPGYRWCVGRAIWDELRKTTMSSFFKFCPRQAYEPYGRRSDTEKILELNNGSSFIWMHFADPDSMSIARGLELNGFGLDQGEELQEEIFTVLMSRLGRWDQVTVPQSQIDAHIAATGTPWPWVAEATGKPLPPSYPIITCNPDHELHWIWQRFHPDSAQWRDKYSKLGYKMFELSTYDNKFATRQNLEQMEAQDETWQRRFLHGKWGIPEGQIHEVRDASLLEPTPEVLNYIMTRCTLHRSMDHGDSAPTCVLWWAVDSDGNCFCYREYYQPNKLISEHRQNVYKLSEFEKYQFQLADPSIFSASMQKNNQRWSVAEEWGDSQALPRQTAVFWQKGDNDEFGTRNRISEYLRPSGVWKMKEGAMVEDDRIHPLTKELGKWPRLFFLKKTKDYPNGCDWVIRETKSQRREKIGTDNGRPLFSDDRDKKISDHSYDCLRYFVASQPPLPTSVQRKYGSNSFMAVRAQAIRTRKQGSYRHLSMDARRTAGRF